MKKKILASCVLFLVVFLNAMIVYAEDKNLADAPRPVYPETTYVHTYEFKVEDNIVDVQKVKDKEVLTRPETPAIPDGKVFKGWTIGGGTVNFNTPIAVTETKTIAVNAILETETVELKYIVDGKIDQTKILNKNAVPKASDIHTIIVEGREFDYWANAKDNTPYDFTKPVTETTELKAVFKDNYRVVFNTTGGKQIYDKYYKKGHKLLKADVPTPERKSYTFMHWSKTEGGPEYAWGTEITGDLTLYAVWKAEKMPYEVRIWLQNAEDDGYSFYNSATIEALPGDVLKDIYGYLQWENTLKAKINSEKSTDLVTPLDPNNTTIVNLYYDRNKYRIILKDKNVIYEGIKWGQDTTPWWNKLLAMYDAVIFKDDVHGDGYYSNPPKMPKRDLDLIPRTGKKQGEIYLHYVEKATGEEIYPTLASVYPDTLPENVHLTIEDFIDIEGFTATDTNQIKYKWLDGKDAHFVLNYIRNMHDILFNTLDKGIIKVEKIPYAALLNDKALPEYVKGVTTRADGKVFNGWYYKNEMNEDVEFIFDGATMPDRNMSLYAKWINPLIKINVWADPEGEGTEKKTFEIEKTHTIRQDIADLEQLKKDYFIYNIPEGMEADEFVKWYWNIEGMNKEINFDINILEEINIYPLWNKRPFNVIYKANNTTNDEFVNALPYGNRVDHLTIENIFAADAPNKQFIYWEDEEGNIYRPNEKVKVVGKDLVLKAIWDEIVDLDTQVIYEGNGGTTTADEKQYTIDNIANNTVIEIDENKFTKTGYDFAGYKLLMWNGTEFEETVVNPGDKVLVDNKKDKITAIIAQWNRQVIEVTIDVEWLDSDGTDLTDDTKKFDINLTLEGDNTPFDVLDLTAGNNYHVEVDNLAKINLDTKKAYDYDLRFNTPHDSVNFENRAMREEIDEKGNYHFTIVYMLKEVIDVPEDPTEDPTEDPADTTDTVVEAEPTVAKAEATIIDETDEVKLPYAGIKNDPRVFETVMLAAIGVNLVLGVYGYKKVRK